VEEAQLAVLIDAEFLVVSFACRVLRAAWP
jgi:hypothetical protein